MICKEFKIQAYWDAMNDKQYVNAVAPWVTGRRQVCQLTRDNQIMPWTRHFFHL